MKTKHFFLCAAMLFAFGNAWAQGPNNSGVYYKDANGLTGKNLKTKLGKIINPHTNVGYDGLFKAYEKTDKRADGKVRDWYSCTTNQERRGACGADRRLCEQPPFKLSVR